MPDVAVSQPLPVPVSAEIHPSAVNAAVAAGQTMTMNSSSLYVGDLTAEVKEALLFDLFNAVGPVASIRVCRDNESRRSLGYAYVNFHNPADAERALDTLNHHELKGRTIRVMWSQRDPAFRRSGVGNIYIKNLEAGIDTKSLYDTFSLFGNILSCKVVPNGESSYGFVHFETQEAADAATEQVNGKLMNNKKVFVGPFVAKKDRSEAQQPGEIVFTNVFVKNLPESYGTEELKALFSSVGVVTSCVLTRDSNGASKCFGFVNMEDPAAAVKAVEELNGKEVDGKNIYVSRAQKKKERQEQLRQKYLNIKLERIAKYQGANLFIKNLAETVNDERLRTEFSRFGTITSSRIMYDEKGNHKGFGFVCFTTPDEAAKAVAETNNMTLDNKPLYVALAQQKDERKEQLANLYARANAMRTMVGQPNMPGQPVYPGNPMFYQPNMPQQRGMVYPPQPAGRRWNNQAAAPGFYMNPHMAPAQQRPHRGGRRGMPMSRGAAPQQQPRMMPPQQMPMQPNMELNSTMLAEASEPEQKEMIGNRLYSLLLPAHNADLSGKITGMFLEGMDIAELLHLLEAPDALNQKVNEALIALASNEEHQKA
eukprot:Awhi_evm1s14